MNRKNIALIGARSAGKSKLSRKLSRAVDAVALSTDTLISYEADGRTIASIVAEKGWKGFREMEYEILKKTVQMEGVIIDCGGGILVEAAEDQSGKETLSQRKIDLLKNHCLVIYLQRPVEYLLDKVKKKDPNRPDLVGDYRDLLKWRLPMYEKYADITVDMSKIDVEQAVVALEQRVKKALGKPD